MDHFPPGADLPPPWQSYLKGNGALEQNGDSLCLVNTGASAGAYTNAQIDDYQGLARRDFLWRPPLRMVIRARFSHPAAELRGTAGFGFWNDPFLMTGWRWPALPRAVWFFFSSPPSNMKLDLNTPGPGWKAATLDAARWPFLVLLPTAPLAVPLMNIKTLYRAAWPLAQAAINVSEAQISADMTDWHTYSLTWQKNTAHFQVDGETVLACRTSPRGPLGFVLWLDNQYMVATPWGHFKHGLLDKPGRQWLEVGYLEITPGLSR